MVTVVLPPLTLLNFQRFTEPLISLSKFLYPVVEDVIDMLTISPPGAIVNFRVTVP